MKFILEVFEWFICIYILVLIVCKVWNINNTIILLFYFNIIQIAILLSIKNMLDKKDREE